MFTLALAAPSDGSLLFAHPEALIIWAAVGAVGLVVGAVAVGVSRRRLVAAALPTPIEAAPSVAVTSESELIAA